jgi:hypothetical protein
VSEQESGLDHVDDVRRNVDMTLAHLSTNSGIVTVFNYYLPIS